jgi:hypothetical protein
VQACNDACIDVCWQAVVQNSHTLNISLLILFGIGHQDLVCHCRTGSVIWRFASFSRWLRLVWTCTSSVRSDPSSTCANSTRGEQVIQLAVNQGSKACKQAGSQGMQARACEPRRAPAAQPPVLSPAAAAPSPGWSWLHRAHATNGQHSAQRDKLRS